MHSLRELTYQLLQVRMDPTDVSQWNALMTVTERARHLLNEALLTYEFEIQGVEFSVGAPSTPCVIALPYYVDHVTYITATSMSQNNLAVTPVRGFKHIPTAMTNLLSIDENLAVWEINGVPSSWLEIGYTQSSRNFAFPKDTTLSSAVNATATALPLTSNPKHQWPASGFAELTWPTTTTEAREVVHYGGMSTSGLVKVTRGVEGLAGSWGTTAVVSVCIPVPNEALPVWMRAAQAALYDALVADRSFYDKYTAIASEQALPPERLAGLARAFEDKADRAYGKTQTITPPVQARVRRFRR